MHRLCTTRILDKVRMDLLGNPRKKIAGDAKGADKLLVMRAEVDERGMLITKLVHAKQGQ